jgi:hypothetical protein
VRRRDEAGYRGFESRSSAARCVRDVRPESETRCTSRGNGGSATTARHTRHPRLWADQPGPRGTRDIRGCGRESPPGANEFAAGKARSPPSRTVAESLERDVGLRARRERTRRCVDRRTRPGRRVHAGGLCEFPAANSFAPAGGRHVTRLGFATGIIRSCMRTARCRSRFAIGFSRRTVPADKGRGCVRDARPQGRDTGAPPQRRERRETGRAGGSTPLATVVSLPTARAARPPLAGDTPRACSRRSSSSAAEGNKGNRA